MNSNPTSLVFIGGFLGAGKTTLLGAAAQRLTAQGKRVGLITNDQAANLVDTSLLRQRHAAVAEVSGGCFCCRFDDLVHASEQLEREHHPDVILGEPVGSCTDIAATVIRPVQRLLAERFVVAPFSVLVDPGRIAELDSSNGSGSFPDDVRYIMQKQVEEADLVVLTKIDTLDSERLAACKEHLARLNPGVPITAVSASTGEGLDAWLNYVQQPRPAGERKLEIDYGQYADGEAALGWLNATVRVQADAKVPWREYCQDTLLQLRDRCREMGAEIAHAKVLFAGDGCVAGANITGNGGNVKSFQESNGGDGAGTLTLNVRAHATPDRLDEAVRGILEVDPRVRTAIERISAFSPSPPVPTHRYGVQSGG